MARVSKARQAEAVAQLRELLKPGDTVYTILRSRSRSGMYRTIALYTIQEGDPRWITRLVADALSYRFDEKWEALGVSGCGMDMGFHVVYNLAATLYPEGFDCTGDGGAIRGHGCPSNDHSNARSHTCPVCGAGLSVVDNPVHVPHLYKRGRHPVCSQACASGTWRHKSGGYALRHAWL